MKKFPLNLVIVSLLLAGSAPAATLVSLASFGGGDGWRAPNEIIPGDNAGTATGSNYNYLQTGSLERGMAYNPVTGNLILVSRSSVGNGIRVLSGVTGADIGALNQGSGVVTGGLFTTNMVGVSSDGAVYVSNLTTNAATTNFKVYQWSNEAAAAPAVSFNTAITSAAVTRLGDSFDVTGPSASVSFVAGAFTGASGYAVINGGTATRVQTFTPALVASDFRLGITFAATSGDVWGKQTGSAVQQTTTAGVFSGSAPLTSAGEAPMDYVTINSIPYLATIDVNNSTVRVYDVSNPVAPALAASLTTTSGTLAANGNGNGSVKWGAITGDTATLYAMSSNQGIQAFTFAVPEPSAAMLGLAGLGLLLRRRRK